MTNSGAGFVWLSCGAHLWAAGLRSCSHSILPVRCSIQDLPPRHAQIWATISNNRYRLVCHTLCWLAVYSRASSVGDCWSTANVDAMCLPTMHWQLDAAISVCQLVAVQPSTCLGGASASLPVNSDTCSQSLSAHKEKSSQPANVVQLQRRGRATTHRTREFASLQLSPYRCTHIQQKYTECLTGKVVDTCVCIHT